MAKKGNKYLNKRDNLLQFGPSRERYKIHGNRKSRHREQKTRKIMRGIIAVVIAAVSVISVFFVITFAIPLIRTELGLGNDVTSNPANTESTSSYVDDIEKFDPKGLPIYHDDVNLFVVNSGNPAEESFQPELENYANLQVDQRITPALRRMVSDAKQEEITLEFLNGFVTYEDQKKYYEQKVDLLVESGLTRVMSRVEAKKTTPTAGESDFQSGMCLRVEWDGEQKEFQDSPVYSWLNMNAIKYGFTFRYPKGKQKHTGLEEDYTVLRYVGFDNASKMRQLSLSLEEFINYSESNSD